jgi:hypothetical protein
MAAYQGDPTTANGIGSEYAMECFGTPTAPANGKLFVILPGTFGVPSDYQDILVEAEHLGYDVIGLSYNNDILVGTLCGAHTGTSPSTDCYGSTRVNRSELARA